MTAKEYFKDHIPHRLNLLITIRERYSKKAKENDSRANLHPELFRDFYRCSKDISILMVRNLLEQVGINFNNDKVKQISVITLSDLKIKIKPIVISKDIEEILIKVLRPAHKSIAHTIIIDRNDYPNHIIVTDSDVERYLIPAVNFVEKIFRDLYLENGFAFDEIMNSKNNNMHRERPLTLKERTDITFYTSCLHYK